MAFPWVLQFYGLQGYLLQVDLSALARESSGLRLPQLSKGDPSALVTSLVQLWRLNWKCLKNCSWEDVHGLALLQVQARLTATATVTERNSLNTKAGPKKANTIANNIPRKPPFNKCCEMLHPDHPRQGAASPRPPPKLDLAKVF